jgi:transcription elongation factor GreB
VGIDETDVPRGHISWISPLGRALLNHKAGDKVTLQMPSGESEFEVLRIEYVYPFPD